MKIWGGGPKLSNLPGEKNFKKIAIERFTIARKNEGSSFTLTKEKKAFHSESSKTFTRILPRSNSTTVSSSAKWTPAAESGAAAAAAAGEEEAGGSWKKAKRRRRRNILNASFAAVLESRSLFPLKVPCYYGACVRLGVRYSNRLHRLDGRWSSTFTTATRGSGCRRRRRSKSRCHGQCSKSKAGKLRP